MKGERDSGPDSSDIVEIGVQENDKVIIGGVRLSDLGLKNREKLIVTGQFPDGPKSKVCQSCNKPMDWRTSGNLKPRPSAKSLRYYSYHNSCNGDCVREAYNGEEAKRKLAALGSTLKTEERDKAESVILAGAYMLKHRSVPENRDKHNSATHRWRQQATLDREDIKIITPHVTSLVRRDIVLFVHRNVGGGLLTKLTGELVIFDTEGVAKSHKHADTTIWAFYSNKKRLWLSITRSGEFFSVVETGKAKVKLDGSNVLDLIDDFVGDGALVYWASANAIDYNRLSDFYTQFRCPRPAKWINAGYDLARLVFG
ncbi:hypothetical protein HK100_007330 [Physocladia obscura]|uniref:Uncharacterized protein n=1 Tax=Physocladia obscura TaxID=109957 RepID=A0AAD5SV44_9FUNG|nr:hypothetical protein HK100_007330 [Physocladia obscura]